MLFVVSPTSRPSRVGSNIYVLNWEYTVELSTGSAHNVIRFNFSFEFSSLTVCYVNDNLLLIAFPFPQCLLGSLSD